MISMFVRTIIIYFILGVMLKLMGKRQIGELEINELVSALLISEIGSLPISDTDIPLIPSLIPILFIACAEVIISVAKNKSNTIKKVVEDEPSYIIYKGRIMQDALRENRISINEVLSEMRTQGIASLGDVRYAILEQNGKISFLKQSDSPNISMPIVIDRRPDVNNILNAGFTEKWLEKELRKRQLNLSDIFLMTVNESGKINVIKKEKDK